MVYLHKVAAMRHGKPQEWPPPGVDDEPAVALLDRAYADLTAEFAARKPDEPTYTWYEPEQTVGFWIRRMAQETVIHRVDAEQALGEPLAEIPDDLAVDGVDEVLERFLAHSSHAWPEDFAEVLPAVEEPVLVRAGERTWLVRATPDGVAVSDSGPGAAATVSGDPVPVLLWLWRRTVNRRLAGPAQVPAHDDGVTLSGDPAAIERLHALLGVATQ
jgi:uncharacterized protein (TIGR03083 family)